MKLFLSFVILLIIESIYYSRYFKFLF